MLDELDDNFKDKADYKDNIISLIKAADQLNLEFVKKAIDAKFILALRLDIFDSLNDSDLNKVRMDNSVHLDWGQKVSLESPLIKLVLMKIRTSIKEFAKLQDDELFNKLFPMIRSEEPEKFLLERTFLRPRDLISFLNIIINRHPNTQYFGEDYILEAEKEYSNYFLNEIKNEMLGHVEEGVINSGFLLLKQFGKDRFKFPEVKSFYETNKKTFVEELNIEKLFKDFYKFGVIGNLHSQDGSGKLRVSFSYPDSLSALHFENDIVIHRGLKKYLLT